MTTIVSTLPFLLLALPVVFAVLFVVVGLAQNAFSAQRAAKAAPPRAIARYAPARSCADDDVTRVFVRAFAR